MKEMADTSQSLKITTEGLELQLSQFSGPMDMLLHMIRENELNIADIPICEITEAYLDLIRKAQEIRYDIAGEYLVMAAMLLYIKSRALIPIVPSEEDGELAEEDPREDLVKKLLIYEEMQQASEILKNNVMLERDTFIRYEAETLLKQMQIQAEPQGIQKGEGFDLATVYLDLMSAFEKKMLQIEAEPINFKAFFTSFVDRLQTQTKHEYNFTDGSWSTQLIVLTVMTLLELSKRGTLNMIQDKNFMPLCVEILNQSGITLDAISASTDLDLA